MDSVDIPGAIENVSDDPARDKRGKSKLLHSSIHRHTLAFEERRNKLIRQQRFYESVDHYDFNQPAKNIVFPEDSSSMSNNKISGKQFLRTGNFPLYKVKYKLY